MHLGIEGMSLYARQDLRQRDRRNAKITLPIICGVSIDADDGRPRARGNIDEANDHHVVELHLPLSKTPLFINPRVEREQLPETVNEPVREKTSQTHVIISLEVFNVPFDAFGNFLD